MSLHTQVNNKITVHRFDPRMISRSDNGLVLFPFGHNDVDVFGSLYQMRLSKLYRCAVVSTWGPDSPTWLQPEFHYSCDEINPEIAARFRTAIDRWRGTHRDPSSSSSPSLTKGYGLLYHWQTTLHYSDDSPTTDDVVNALTCLDSDSSVKHI